MNDKKLKYDFFFISIVHNDVLHIYMVYFRPKFVALKTFKKYFGRFDYQEIICYWNTAKGSVMKECDIPLSVAS